MMKRVFDLMRAIFSSVFFLYVVLFLCSFLFVDYKDLKHKVELATLDRFRPASFKYLLNYRSSEGPIDQKLLRKYVKYFETTVRIFPKLSEPYAILGHCYYHQGDISKAIELYEKSSVLNPYFFWNQYDLGLLYYKKGLYKDARKRFEKALLTQIDGNVAFLTSSRIYYPFLEDAHFDFPIIKKELKDGYSIASLFLLKCYAELKQYSQMRNSALFAIASNLNFIADYYYYAGLASYELRYFPEALASFQSCLKNNPEHVEALYYLGMTLGMLGKEEPSLKALEASQSLKMIHESGLVDLTNRDTQIF